MSSLIANPFNFVDFGDTSVDENDWEVEEILNEIGFFASDDSRYESSFGGESSLPVSSEAFAPPQFAPVSPEHHSVETPLLPISRVSPSISIEATTTFSVPNPISVTSLDLSFSASVSSVETVVRPDPAPKSSKRITRPDPANGRKRKLSEKTTALKVPGSLSVRVSKDKEEAELTEEQLEERRQRNREHAKRSRQRKKSLTCTLQDSLDNLKEENTKLREQINAMLGSDKVDSILEKRRSRELGHFMAGLMQPSNRILDDGTISFLKGLHKNLPSAQAMKRQKTSEL